MSQLTVGGSGTKPSTPPQATTDVTAFANLIGSLRRIKAKQARLSDERKQHEKALKAALSSARAQVGTVNDVPVVSFSSSLRIGLDQSELKHRYPEIAKECSDITEVWTFKLLDA